MILYRDMKSGERLGPPEWLLDQDGNWAPGLQCRDDSGGRLWGIGDAYMVGPHKGGWEDLAGGWQTRVVGTIDPTPLRRVERWVDAVPVDDLNGIIWMAPLILTPMGHRAFRVTFGRDFLPALTARQKRLLAITEEARSTLEKARDGGEGVDMTIGCQWAAELMSGIHYLTPEVIGANKILDEALTVSVLAASSSLSLGALHD